MVRLRKVLIGDKKNCTHDASKPWKFADIIDYISFQNYPIMVCWDNKGVVQKIGPLLQCACVVLLKGEIALSCLKGIKFCILGAGFFYGELLPNPLIAVECIEIYIFFFVGISLAEAIKWKTTLISFLLRIGWLYSPEVGLFFFVLSLSSSVCYCYNHEIQPQV